MPIALWVTLSVVVVAAALIWVLAVRMKKSLVPIPTKSSPSPLTGPHWQARSAVPERYANRHVLEPTGSTVVAGLTKTEAEELLDWLEANGIDNRELTQADDQGFVVRYW